MRELEAAGYDRSFGLLGKPRRARLGLRTATFRDISLDGRSRAIALPQGLGFDSGGLGKGWAADRVARILGSPCLVDAGGDIATLGRPPDEDAWYIAVEDPLSPTRDVALLAVSDRGVATSSTLKRRWPTDAGYAHHLIDSRTGLPSASDAVSVTVVAESATMADFHAKVALLQGIAKGLRYVEGEDGVEALLIDRDGRLHVSSGLARYAVTTS